MKPGAEWPVLTFGNPANPPVVMLHGFLGASADWTNIASALAEEHYVLCPDLPGHGANPLQERVPFASVAAGLLACLDANGIESTALVGYSMGGRIALHFALEHPHRVSRLVLESASPGIDDEHTRESRSHHDDLLASELMTLEDRESVEAWLRQWYSAPLWGSLHKQAGLVDALVAERAGANPQSLAHAMSSYSVGRQPSLWPALPYLVMPTLLITGEHDHKYVEIAERMTQANPALATMALTDCGHNVHLESPGAYTTVLKSFLSA